MSLIKRSPDTLVLDDELIIDGINWCAYVTWYEEEKTVSKPGGQLCECEGGLLWRYWIICSFIESDQDLWLYSGNMLPRGHIIDTNAESHKRFYHLLLKYHV